MDSSQVMTTFYALSSSVIDTDGDGIPDDQDVCALDPLNDADGDSYCEGELYADTMSGGGDCDDSNPAVNPGATEVCNGIDDNCDGAVDENDVLPPTTTKTEAGTLGSNGWYTTDVTLSLDAVDNPETGACGAAQTLYSFDNIDFQTSPNPFTITAEGETSVFYRSIDAKTPTPNVEPVQSQVEKVDKTPPTLTVNPVTTPTNMTSQTVTGTASDLVSGLASVAVNGAPASIAGDAWTGSIYLAEGMNTIDVAASDNAGLTTTEQTEIFLDTVPPVVVKTSPADNTRVTDEDLTTPGIQIGVEGTATDDAPSSGLTDVAVNGEVIPLIGGAFSGVITLSTGDLQRITATATDGAGNYGLDMETVCAADIEAPPLSTSKGLLVRYPFTVYGSGQIEIGVPIEYFIVGKDPMDGVEEDVSIEEGDSCMFKSHGKDCSWRYKKRKRDGYYVIAFNKTDPDPAEYTIDLMAKKENVKKQAKLVEWIEKTQSKLDGETDPQKIERLTERIEWLQEMLVRARATITFTLDSTDDICDLTTTMNPFLYSRYEVALEKDKYSKKNNEVIVQHMDVDTVVPGGENLEPGQPTKLEVKVTGIPKGGSAELVVKHYADPQHPGSPEECIQELNVIDEGRKSWKKEHWNRREWDKDERRWSTKRTEVFESYYTYTCGYDDLIEKQITIRDANGDILITQFEYMPIVVNNNDGWFCTTFGWFC